MQMQRSGIVKKCLRFCCTFDIMELCRKSAKMTKISEVQAVYPEKGKRLSKGPSIAYVENQGICVKNTKKNIFDLFKYN